LIVVFDKVGCVGVHPRKELSIRNENDRGVKVAAPSGRATLSRRRLRRYAVALISAIDGVGTRVTLEPELWLVSRERDTSAELQRPTLETFVHE
jgi:hypothetical protein